MKPEIERQLQTILDGQQKQKETAAIAADERAKAEAKNTSDFETLKEEVIKPAFQEIIKLFEARGLPVYLSERDEEKNSRGGTTPASISLQIYERGILGNLTPEFKFFYHNGSRKVSLYTSTRSQGGPGQDVAFDGVTADWIQDEFAKYAQRL